MHGNSRLTHAERGRAQCVLEHSQVGDADPSAPCTGGNTTGGRPSCQYKEDKGGGKKSCVTISGRDRRRCRLFPGADVSLLAKPSGPTARIWDLLPLPNRGTPESYVSSFGRAVQQRVLKQRILSRCVDEACQALHEFGGIRNSRDGPRDVLHTAHECSLNRLYGFHASVEQPLVGNDEASFREVLRVRLPYEFSACELKPFKRDACSFPSGRKTRVQVCEVLGCDALASVLDPDHRMFLYVAEDAAVLQSTQ